MEQPKSPVRTAIEKYLDRCHELKVPQADELMKEALVEVAKVAIEQERTRIINALYERRPVLSRYNNWVRILE